MTGPSVVTRPLLIRGGWVLTAAPAGSGTPALIRDGAIVIHGGLIAAVGPHASLAARYPDASVVGGPNDLVTPGFVNTHGHFSEGLIAGMASQYTLWEWLDQLARPTSAHLTREMASAGTLLAGIQMLRSGITTVNDMFIARCEGPEPVTPGVVTALDELGLRGVVSYGAGDLHGPQGIDGEFAEHDALREAASRSRLSTFRLGISVVGAQSDTMLKRSVEYAVGGGFGVHVHLQEVREEVTASVQRWGQTSIAHAADSGLFEAPTLAAHCVWTDRADRRILAEHNVGVAHNPVANMILASGVAAVAEMRELGIHVGIGVDGAGSNDSQDMMQAMKSAALLARVSHQQATAMSSREAFEFATIGGAQALQMADRVGSLEPGKAADVVVFDGDSPALANVHDPYQSLVFVAGSREVRDVWVDGRLSLSGGSPVNVDVAEVVARSRPLAQELVTRAGLGRLSYLAAAGLGDGQPTELAPA